MVLSVWAWTFTSVFVISLISLIGVVSLGVAARRVRTALVYVISFAAGALLGDSFIHLLPEVAKETGFTVQISLSVLSGVVLFFFLEKVIHWQHCHGEITEENHVHAFAYMNLIGDGLHNLLDGIIVAASFLVSVPVGIATSVAVLLHEIPQEIGDYGILVHGGFSRGKALLVNFASALFAFIGAGVTLLLTEHVRGLETFIVSIGVGGFIYIAAADLIPEIHKHSHSLRRSLLQLFAFVVGIIVMVLLLLIE